MRRKTGSRENTPAQAGHSTVPAGEQVARRAAIVIWLWLALVTGARAALAFVPSMDAWGLNLHRFISPATAWIPWAVCALALFPPVSRRILPLLDGFGERLHRAPRTMTTGLAAMLAAFVWSFPDRAFFTGDFLGRLAAVRAGVEPGTVYPQAMPLDLFLHHHVPVFAGRVWGLDPNVTERLIGLSGVIASVVLAVLFVRTLGVRTAAGIAVLSIVLFGGWLATFTGLGKPFGELCVLTLAAAVFSLRVAKEGRGHVALGLTLAIAVWLHRAGLALLLPAAVAWILWLRTTPRRWSFGATAGAIVPVTALAFAAPRIVRAIAAGDGRNFLPEGVAAVPAGALSALHLLDVANLLMLLSPVALLAAILFIVFRIAPPREAAVMAALAAPFVAMALLVHPPQGAYRDWDMFAAAGVAFAACAAWLVGTALRLAPARTWVAPAIVCVTAVPAIQWVLHLSDEARALSRVEALVQEAPARASDIRAITWTYLGLRNGDAGRADASADAWRHAAELAPSPRILVSWAAAEEGRGNFEQARAIYVQATERDPAFYEAWLGLAGVAARLGDRNDAKRIVEKLLASVPGEVRALALLESIEGDTAVPDAAAAAAP